MKNDFTWGDDIIDSRDIIARHEELKDDYDTLLEALEEAKKDLENYNEENPDGEDPAVADELVERIKEAQENLDKFDSSDDKADFVLLDQVISEGESSPDWSYGESLIHENYFTQYAEQLANDCCEMPKEFTSGEWPWRHMEMDWEAAADELKNDYFEIYVDGETYFIRG